MCIPSPHTPATPPPPPPPPPPPQPHADRVSEDPTTQAAQDLAARLGTSQLVIPLVGLNIPG